MKDHKQLIEDYLNGDLSDADAIRLRAWLAADAEHMRQFIRRTHQHGILRAELHGAEELERFADGQQATIKPPRQSPCDKKDKSTLSQVYCFFAQPTPLSMTVAGAVIGLLVISMAFMAPPFYRAITKSKDPVADPNRIVAEVTMLHEVQWNDLNDSFHRGAFLVPGRALRLKQGTVEITYRDDAVVVLQGACEYIVNDLGRGELTRGRLLAHVPESAIGFRVTTPSAEITDLGTQFGVEVDSDGTSEVVVLQGRVECARLDANQKPLANIEITAGRSAAIALRASDDAALAAKWGDFKTDIARMEQSATNRLFAHWALDESAGVTVHDSTPRKFHGTLRGGTWDAAGKHGGAVRFAGGKERIDLSSHADRFARLRFGAISFWFKSTSAERSGLFRFGRSGTNDRLVIEIGAKAPGRLRLVVRKQEVNILDIQTEATFNDGSWHHVVATQNGRAAAVYVDGQLITDFTTNVNSGAWLHDIRDADELWVGRDDFANSHGRISSFDGWMDDVAVFHRPLSSDHVGAIYRFGVSTLDAGEAPADSRNAVGQVQPKGETP